MLGFLCEPSGQREPLSHGYFAMQGVFAGVADPAIDDEVWLSKSFIRTDMAGLLSILL